MREFSQSTEQELKAIPTGELTPRFNYLVDLKAWGSEFYKLRQELHIRSVREWVCEDVFGQGK